MKRILILCFLLLFLGCNRQSFNIFTQPEKFHVDATFVDSFLRWNLHKSVSNEVPIVITKQLQAVHLWDEDDSFGYAAIIAEAKQKNKKLVEAVNDFFHKNNGKNNINSIGKLTVKHVVLTEKQRSNIFINGGWENFYKVYPDSEGYIVLSRPGFSKDGTIAVIYMTREWGVRAGASRYYVMEMKEGKWIRSSMYIGVTLFANKQINVTG